MKLFGIILLFVCLLIQPSNAFFAGAWAWYTYHFKYSDRFTHFNSKVCWMNPVTLRFGGQRLSKFVIGEYVMWPTNKISSILGLKGGPTNSIIYDPDGYPHFAGAAPRQLARERWMPLMIGSDYEEPCRWKDRTPKLLSYKFSTAVDQMFGRGAFDVYFGRGTEQCGEGRLGQFGPRPKDPADQMVWQSRVKDVLSGATPWYFGYAPTDGDASNPPFAAFNSGGIVSGDQGDKLSKGGRVFTSALFDETLSEQTLCVIFYCKNEYMYCTVTIEHFQVSDISGKTIELPRGSVFWQLTPQDIFALFMTFFSVLFFCIQCCCFCKICCNEMSGGVVDEEAIMEKEIKRQYLKERGRGPKVAGRQGRGGPEFEKGAKMRKKVKKGRKSKSPKKRGSKKKRSL